MIIAGIDTETTGLDQARGAKLIEVAILQYDFDTRALLSSFVQRIDPMQPIEAGAQRVHKIAYCDLVGMPTWEVVAPIVLERLDSVDLMVAHNMAFDGPFLAGELSRIGCRVPNIDTFCTKENARWACADGKWPRLGELCFALGVEYDTTKAHSAEYDVEVMMACFFKGLDRGFFTISNLIDNIKENKEISHE